MRLFVSVAVSAAVVVAGLGACTTRDGTPAPTSASAASASAASASAASASAASASPSSSAPPAPSGSTKLLARARSGDLAALKTLESRDADTRTVDGALAIADGRQALARRDLEALLERVAADRELLDDRAILARLHGFATGELSRDALAGLARIAHPAVADLLDAVARAAPESNRGWLARDLLRTRPLASAASPALAVALELEQRIADHPTNRPGSAEPTRCRAVQRAVRKAAEVGDRRCRRALRRLTRIDGCGRGRRDDCFPCLRGSGVLEGAERAAKGRLAPTPWILPR